MLDEDLEVVVEDNNKMPRPCRQRRVRGKPGACFFKPAGIPRKNLQESVLNFAEFEAVRLKDYLGLEQNECAQKMEVSQPTFHRILVLARKKIAQAIVKGNVIKIER